MKWFKHFKMVNKHRKEVRRLCFKCGLYWQGLTHDLSKFSFIEFIEGIKYYDGTKSSTAVCRDLTGKSEAWEHHKRKNKHHPEYWINQQNDFLMPYNYLVESICDRIAACKIYKSQEYTQLEPLKYWNKQKEKGYQIHPKIAKAYDIVFSEFSEKGEKILNKNYLTDLYNKVFKEDNI